MSMESFKSVSTEEIKSAKEQELKMMKEGAKIDENGQLIATENQVERAHFDMEADKSFEKYKKFFPTTESWDNARSFINEIDGELQDNPNLGLDYKTIEYISQRLEEGYFASKGGVS